VEPYKASALPKLRLGDCRLVCVQVPVDLADRLDFYAMVIYCSKSAIIRQALDEYLTAHQV